MPNQTDDEFARKSLQRRILELADELHWAIDEGLTTEHLHSIVGLWEANNNHEDITYAALVEDGQPTVCDDCNTEVLSYDEDGRLAENSCEYYMVRDEVWTAASGDAGPSKYLCIGCLEERLGRQLQPRDFANVPLNEISGLESPRLLDRLGAASHD